jgi:hypothetical protein
MSTGGAPISESVKGQSKDRLVDHSALRTNQVFIIGLLLIAFIISSWLLVAFVAVVMVVGTVLPNAGLFKAIYFKLLKPRNLVQADVKVDNPEPHLFAQGLGGMVLTVATIALLVNSGIVGWMLGWIVIALAALNLFAGICIGCIIYYQLNRLGIPGFTKAPLKS